MTEKSFATCASWQKYNTPVEAVEVLAASPLVLIASTTEELVDLACGGAGSAACEVAYEVPGQGRVVEATVARVRNGVAANYPEPYMRRRDPDCMVIGDAQPTDKDTFLERFGEPFEGLRKETLAWLKTQELAMFGFHAGGAGMGMDALVIAPANAGFFALGLAMLQGILPESELPDTPRKRFDVREIVFPERVLTTRLSSRFHR